MRGLIRDAAACPVCSRSLSASEFCSDVWLVLNIAEDAWVGQCDNHRCGDSHDGLVLYAVTEEFVDCSTEGHALDMLSERAEPIGVVDVEGRFHVSTRTVAQVERKSSR